MAPKLEQTASASIVKGEGYTVKVTFDRPTKTGNLIVLSLSAAGGMPVNEIINPNGFTLIKDRGLRDIQLTAWYRENAPATTEIVVSVQGRTQRSLQVRAMEYSGVRQVGAFDRVVSSSGESRNIVCGSTGNLTQSDSLVVCVVSNQFGSTAQHGFFGGLIRLFEQVTPDRKHRWRNEDWERSRMTIHHTILNVLQSISFFASLSCTRRWICFLICFKGGSLGPVKFASVKPDRPACSTSGRGQLSAFGPLRATLPNAKPQCSNPSEGAVARISPFDYQYRIGGWSGFLVGSGTRYKVEGSEGLGGFEIRNSDSDLPRGDGAIRGIDLESAREFTMAINVGRSRDEIELLLDQLYRALIPRRDEDIELIWRHPTQIPRMMRVRPISLPRIRNSMTNQSYARQEITFRAADPRHYSAVPVKATVANTPANGTPVQTQISNLGNIDAYPLIRIEGPTSGPPVTSIEISNKSTLQTLKLELLLPSGSVVLADMEARVTAAPRSVITLDEEPRYGAWQLPRDPFIISADPLGQGGFNLFTMETVPAGAPIKVTFEYRHTWSG